MKKIIYILSLFIIVNIAYSQPLFLEQVSGVTTPLNHAYPTGWSGSNIVYCWICGNNGVVLKTTAAGGTWTNVGLNGIPSTANINFITCSGASSITAIALGVKTDTAIVYRTTNAGVNWQVVLRQYQGSFNGVKFSQASGFLVGNPVGGRWSIWKSSNEGLTWDSTGLYLPRNGTEIGFPHSFASYPFVSGTGYIFGTNNYRIYYSTNQGNSWTFISMPQEQNIYAMHFPSSLVSNLVNGYFGGTTKIYYTSNSGTNWVESNTIPGAGAINGMIACPVPVQIPGAYDVMVTKNDNVVYRNPAYNYNWLPVYTAASGNYRYISNSAIGMYMVYAVRDNGGISWGSCGMGGVIRLSEIIPVNYSLAQNYPNPFNPVTKIVFDIPVNSFVRISVFDIAGKEVARLVESNITSGSYQTDWDASLMASGIYFYSMISHGTDAFSGDFVQTKKMILVK